jgi:shikimate dehydrogenase
MTPQNTIPFYSFGLIGYPLGHSLSPRIHLSALHDLGMDGEYNLYQIPPLPVGEDRLVELFAQIREGGIQGLNVTIPHKETCLPFLDSLTSTSQAIGAVNTIFMRNGKLTGDNTDVSGFWRDIRRFILRNRPEAPDLEKTALVLGAGGSAHAVVYALITQGYEITIASRRLEQAEHLRSQFTAFDPNLTLCLLANLPDYEGIWSLVINTTPVGMHPNVDGSPWPVGMCLPKHALVYDLVYNPFQTTLVRQAREAGLIAVSGLGMLVEQAALSFEIWTGFEAPRAVMLDSIYDTVNPDCLPGKNIR